MESLIPMNSIVESNIILAAILLKWKFFSKKTFISQFRVLFKLTHVILMFLCMFAPILSLVAGRLSLAGNGNLAFPLLSFLLLFLFAALRVLSTYKLRYRNTYWFTSSILFFNRVDYSYTFYLHTSGLIKNICDLSAFSWM